MPLDPQSPTASASPSSDSPSPAVASTAEFSGFPPAPLLPGEEWLNALTHGVAAAAWVGGAAIMYQAAAQQSVMTIICCLAFVASAIAVFTASALSHYWIDEPQRLHRLRAWDQGLIYAMISGTYTPLIWQFADESIRGWLLAAIWLVAFVGFYTKVIAKYRVNGIGTISYLLLGWLPAIPLAGRVPAMVLFWMAAGGVIYTLGVVLLLNDRRMKYLHAGWHVCVVTAASCHYWAIYRYVAMAD